MVFVQIVQNLLGSSRSSDTSPPKAQSSPPPRRMRLKKAPCVNLLSSDEEEEEPNQSQMAEPVTPLRTRAAVTGLPGETPPATSEHQGVASPFTPASAADAGTQPEILAPAFAQMAYQEDDGSWDPSSSQGPTQMPEEVQEDGSWDPLSSQGQSQMPEEVHEDAAEDDEAETPQMPEEVHEDAAEEVPPQEEPNPWALLALSEQSQLVLGEGASDSAAQRKRQRTKSAATPPAEEEAEKGAKRQAMAKSAATPPVGEREKKEAKCTAMAQSAATPTVKEKEKEKAKYTAKAKSAPTPPVAEEAGEDAQSEGANYTGANDEVKTARIRAKEINNSALMKDRSLQFLVESRKGAACLALKTSEPPPSRGKWLFSRKLADGTVKQSLEVAKRALEELVKNTDADIAEELKRAFSDDA